MPVLLSKHQYVNAGLCLHTHTSTPPRACPRYQRCRRPVSRQPRSPSRSTIGLSSFAVDKYDSSFTATSPAYHTTASRHTAWRNGIAANMARAYGQDTLSCSGIYSFSVATTSHVALLNLVGIVSPFGPLVHRCKRSHGELRNRARRRDLGLNEWAIRAYGIEIADPPICVDVAGGVDHVEVGSN